MVSTATTATTPFFTPFDITENGDQEDVNKRVGIVKVNFDKNDTTTKLILKSPKEEQMGNDKD